MALDSTRSNVIARTTLILVAALASACSGISDQIIPYESTEVCAVNRVVDGDGVRLNCGRGYENLNVRLDCIDAPETDQPPWGDQATERLRTLLHPEVGLRRMDIDRYGRTIGRIYRNGEDVNLRLVHDGKAAVYPRYCEDPRYYQAEQAARRAGRGIWAESGLHQEPWLWRGLR